jgi:hypothetical protein
MYSILCHVHADTTELCKNLQPRTRFGETTFYQINFEVVLAFGLTELKAYIRWDENVSTVPSN